MDVTIQNLKINIVEENNEKGVFSFEPLPTGFGYTLANALRRVLLTSIKGAAITQVRIKGVNHQFTTLPGIKEDIVQFTLNLKRVRVKSYSENPVVATISKKGAGKITAADIETSADVEILNKDIHLATLADKNAEINVELVVEQGVGYSPMEKRETPKIGVIVLDAIFSPIKHASFSIEPARFADRTDLDKIVLYVETDGSITPKNAVQQASGLVREFFEAFEKWEASGEKPEIESTADIKKYSADDVAVEELPLQTRTINALKKSGIDTLGKLSKKTEEDLLDIKNLGEKSLDEIRKLLKKEGFKKDK